MSLNPGVWHILTLAFLASFSLYLVFLLYDLESIKSFYAIDLCDAVVGLEIQ
jgi:hypothetical protein